jgi:hypothetical protein
MAWEGWYEFGGVEIINTDRTEAYAKHASVGWFKPVYNNGTLAQLTDEPEYTSPLQDDAPWLDPDSPASQGFYGAYPLEITGIEDSTVTAPVTESTGDGGVVGRTRRATRSVVFNLALIGEDECATEYGFNWLRDALSGGPCTGRSDQDCNIGNNLCFLACPPGLDMFTPYVPEGGTTTATVARRNLSTNPSMEKSVAGWSANSGVGVPSRVLSNASHGSGRLQATGTNTTTKASVVQGVAPLAPGDVISISAKVRSDAKRLNKNGSMDANVASWVGGGTATIKHAPAELGYVNGAGIISWGINHAALGESIAQAVTGLVIGRSYTLTAVLKNNDANAAKAKPALRIAGMVNSSAVTTVGTWTRRTITFTATATAHTIAVVNTSTTARGNTYVDEMYLTANATPTKGLLNVATDGGTLITEFQPAWAPDANGWSVVSGTITVPAGATGILVRPGVVTAGNYNDYLGVDEVLIEKAPTVGTYFDGDTGDTSLYQYDWVGPAGLSTSTQSDLTVDPATVPDPPPFDPSICFEALLRSLHACTTTVGPVVTGKRTTTNGGCVWTVSVTVVAANPVVFSDEKPLIRGFGDPNVEVPYIGGIIPPGGSFDADGFIETEVDCAVPTWQPLVDPECPIVIAPPAVPSISLSCFEFPVNYKRRQFTIPPQRVPLWGKIVPYFEILTPGGEVRSLRLRFYADPDGDGSTVQDACSFCGDIVFSYIPAGSAMIFDGADHQVYVQAPNGTRQRADALVFGSDGAPFEWPELTCGYGYVVTLDLPQTGTVPVVNMSLYSRVA